MLSRSQWLATHARELPHRQVSEERVREAVDHMVALRATCEVVRERDVSCDSSEDAKAWLRGLPISPETRVMWIWPADRHGIEALVPCLEELWRPSADDVWIVPCEGRGWVELDHEEVFRFGLD